ncbi:DNA-directed RNA polymerases I, II, and III subunit RPABC3 [Clonorchis sinensis]|uniref:DNA-directed RNA polymerases I, II, and III subunit RPABC3 n=1 Tax=Clonorchis sinensis TaxID=79923 RepID=A0A419QAK5_CLOSI|nr:DNA-directed RNA polymerases I, II, and III subunit RPABC3 [Clonorchis sinensis]
MASAAFRCLEATSRETRSPGVGSLVRILMSALLEDIFDVKDVDKDGKKFDKVSRLFCESESFKMGLILDIHALIYRLVKGDKFRMVLTKNLLNDMITDAEDDDEDDAAEETDERLANSKMAEFDYVCYGKIYRIEAHDSGVDASRLSCYVSFGGLLMQLTGDASLSNLAVSQPSCFLLVACQLGTERVPKLNVFYRHENLLFVVALLLLRFTSSAVHSFGCFVS